ncbi:MAG TPA: hypothetical protein VFB72_18655 [Verrucomicrobiae bacterium]|nr:hypothetical protein [Verrucomicrobiae bacterium]
MKVFHFSLRGTLCACALASFLILIFATSQPARAQVNNWISSSSGDWESPQWSFGLPAKNEDIFITNAGTKTIVIEQTTTQYNPSILNIEALTISAAAGSSNTLFMNYAGLESPLTIANLSLGANSAVVMDGSALAATNQILMNGIFTQDKSSTVATAMLEMGEKNPATYYLASGTLAANYIDVGLSFPSFFVQASGINACDNGIRIYGGSVYDLKGGELDGSSVVHAGGTFKMEGGICNCLSQASWIDGSFLQSGGIITNALEMGLPIPMPAGHQAGASGKALQTGGTNNQNNLTLGVFTGTVGYVQNLNVDGGTYTLSNGWLNVGSISVWCRGSIAQYGGVHTVGQLNLNGAAAINIYDPVMIDGMAPAAYTLAAGLFSATTVNLGLAGVFTQSGGTNIISDSLNFANVYPGANGTYSLNGGLLLVSNLSAAVPSAFSQSGGKLIAQNVSGNCSQSGGTAKIGNLSANYSLSGGSLIATNLTVSDAVFQHTGGTCTIVNNLTLNDGTWQDGTTGQTFGQLQLGAGTNSIIQFPTNACSLQFADSSGVTWSNNGVLTIVNWNGSLSGAGTNVLAFGSSTNALTAKQLSQIQFANPAGFGPGNYLAKMLPDGEIVPGVRNFLDNPPAPFFAGEASLGGGWYYLASSNHIFGDYNLQNYPYVLHLDMGWEYFLDANNPQHGGYFYDFADTAFFYTEPGMFPYLYDFNINAWLYYSPASETGRYTSNPRWFYNFSTQAWVNHL